MSLFLSPYALINNKQLPPSPRFRGVQNPADLDRLAYSLLHCKSPEKRTRALQGCNPTRNIRADGAPMAPSAPAGAQRRGRLLQPLDAGAMPPKTQLPTDRTPFTKTNDHWNLSHWTRHWLARARPRHATDLIANLVLALVLAGIGTKPSSTFYPCRLTRTPHASFARRRWLQPGAGRPI